GDRKPARAAGRNREDMAAPQPCAAQGLSWSMTEDEDIDGLAAEYALGSLSPTERRQVDARRQADASLAAAIAAWERRLAPLSDRVPGVAPPPQLLDGILSRISGPA